MVHAGVDLVRISRIAETLKEDAAGFFKTVCTDKETARLQNEKRQTDKTAAVFGLKEAFSKAFGTGIGSELSFKDLEVTYTSKGRPELNYIGKKDLNIQVSASVSHEGDYLVAMVVIQGDL